MEMVIVGHGLVSPLGLSAAEHAFFVRASASAPVPPAFETADGKPVRARHCGFLGAALDMAERLSRMGEIAAHEALSPSEAAGGTGPLALAFVAPLRAGITPEAVVQTRSHLANRCRATLVQTWHDAAGAFAALEHARGWLSRGDVTAVLVVAVDSFMHADALRHDLSCSQSPFLPDRPTPGEGAAAVLLTRDDVCRAHALEGARVYGGGTALGRATDDDDVIIDGAAMTSLLCRLPERRIDLIVGQENVDELRARDWAIASARTARRGAGGTGRPAPTATAGAGRFAEQLHAMTLEDHTGRLGAAAGVACLSFGVAALRHRIFRELSPTAHFVAWAISRDGTRGLALVEGAARTTKSAMRPLVAVHDGPSLRSVERGRFQVTAAVPAAFEARAVPAFDPGAVPRVPLLDGISGLTGAEAERSSPPSAASDATSPVRLAKGRGAPLPLAATYGEIADACLDGIALAARHRTLLPREGRAREEERILAFVDALVVTPRFPSLLVAWWEEASELPDSWKVWAPSFVLACLEGDDVPEALAALWRWLGEDDVTSAAIAGEALVLGGYPERLAWARRLLADAHPAVRAAALEALSLAHAIEANDVVGALVSDAERTVRWAAVRAAARLREDGRLDELLLDELVRASDGELAWQSARALALRGIPAGYIAMQRDPDLLQRLGPRALDVLALLGDASDALLARQIVARLGLTSEVLRGLGRYGHPGAAPVLLRALGDEDAAEDASAALVWIFGTPFEEHQITSPDAWRAWLRKCTLDEATRYRFGKPYRPGCVAEAAVDGARSQADLAWLVDEASVRAGLSERASLFRWSPAADAALAPVLTALAREDRAFVADTWRSAARVRGRRS
ncbi:hypothetical protein WME94_33375 [Sorangium sp. So ce429]